MNVLTNTWRQLVQRRLWPVALLLVAALAAVPVLLAAEPERVASPADPVPALSADDELAEPVVAKVAAGDRTRRRRVLGIRKDPFKPAPVKTKKASATNHNARHVTGGAKPATGQTTPTTGTTTPTTVTGGGDYAGTPAPPVVAPRKPTYPADSIIVRFGDATSDELPKGVLEKLSPLPDDEEPLLVYMGLTKKGKKAVFLVDAALTPTGDGTCKPHPSSCETVELSRGETEFFDVVDPETGRVGSQYQLDLVAINN